MDCLIESYIIFVVSGLKFIEIKSTAANLQFFSDLVSKFQAIKNASPENPNKYFIVTKKV